MENNMLRTLLYKYFHDELTEKELEKLRSMINGISDDTFRKALDFIWNSEGVEIPMNPLTKSDVLQSIHNIVNPDKTVIGQRFNWWRVAAIIMMPITLLVSLSLLSGNKPDVQEYTVFAEYGQKNRILLPDGTHIWLNSGSEISYTSDFNQANRNIKLKGEAFFDVKKNTRHSFNVEVDSINIQVLGTVFNVSAYDNAPDIKVSLERGKVEIRKNRDNLLLATLNPNEQASVDRKKLLAATTACDAWTESIWHQNILTLHNVSAEEMIKKLERWYGVNITVQNLTKSRKYGFTIKDESLREMLELINIITPISYRIEGEEVTIRYK
jgi:ferric-dicitrate binding protein FerR (iron transport regulator)